jgi:MFS family permease
MIRILGSTWALLLGLFLLMIGNGVQGTLLGIRGGIEGFTTQQMSIVMSAYFVGFLFGSRLAPLMIRNVGHVRVFAALGSMISAALILYAALPDWMVWALLRVLVGFCFSGVYVTVESWLNNATDNANRGKALSLYMIVQMVGIITAQGLVNVADPTGYILFVIPSVLVSLAFTPILLSTAPAPSFGSIRSMPLRELMQISPLGAVGAFLMGGVFSALFGMAAVWGTLDGLSVLEITIFTAAIYLGGLVFQYPVGWMSDRMDRRRLIAILAMIGTGGALATTLLAPGFGGLVAVAILIGGISNPLYALLVSHTNDFLDSDSMAGASGGLLFLNGIGAALGPLALGGIMALMGAQGYFAFIGVLTGLLAAYALWRMTRRPGVPVAQTGPYAPISPIVSSVTIDAVYAGLSEVGELESNKTPKSEP